MATYTNSAQRYFEADELPTPTGTNSELSCITEDPVSAFRGLLWGVLFSCILWAGIIFGAHKLWSLWH
jgi:hypothetical protein